MSWQLRRAKKTIYGPVELPELCRWASEGRVLFDDEVRENETSWKPAAEIADLELNWLAPDADGALRGPFHILLFADLLKRNVLLGNNLITHRITNEQSTVAQAVTAELTRRIETLSAIASEKSAEPVRHVEKDNAVGLEKTVQDMTRRYEAMLARTREQEDELGDLRQKLATTQQSANEQLAKADAARQRAEEEAATQHKKIESLQTIQNDLAQNFRELNERYIELRDKTGAAPDGKPRKPKARLV
ncbi:MAG: hypothetical protein M5U15_07625 [Kiritimatiellae bacterium]|nr:hypothetical protein [Kiritimatiellia bacterium]